MANVYAIKSGNWSDPTIWNTGALPTSSDDVFSNNFTVQVDATCTVLSVRNTASAPILAGGTFNLNNGSNLTCTAAIGVYVGSATPTITFALAAGNSATVTATIPSIQATATYAAVLLNGLGTLNFTGDISCGPTSTSNMRVINITAAGTLNYNGVCTNGGNTTNQCNSIYSSAAATINIITTGFAGGNTLTQANSSIFMNAGGTLSITSSGNITNGTSPAITIVGGVSLTIVGSIVGGSIEAIRNVTTAIANTTVTGSITAGNAANAIVALGGVRVVGPLVNTNQFMAVYAPRIAIEPTTTSITFQKIGGGTQIMYIGSATSFNLPATNDVRLGTVYGQSNEFTGSMVVQTPNNVLLGTLVDNTVGTLIMTPDNLVQELGTNTRPIAVRLQNSSTVDTTGNQMASYNI